MPNETTNILSRNRYPGVKPFVTEQKELFFGRENDINDLFDLILARHMVILYGKSGFGKSSLINAGIVPKLQAETAYQHFLIRFNNFSNTETNGLKPYETLNERLKNTLTPSEQIFSTLLEFTDGETPLWYWIKTLQWYKKQEQIILFFDQFEELFTYLPQDIEALSANLAEVLYMPVPLKYRQQFSVLRKAGLLSDEFYNFLNDKPDVKVVFSIRADRMSLLNTLTIRHPAILSNCYELAPLTTADARIAIIEPARLENTLYTSPTFAYTEEIINEILLHIANKQDGKIETAVLQIVCKYIEDTLVNTQQKHLIELQDLGDMSSIFQKYYEGILNSLSLTDRDKTQELIEEKLITNNQRNSLSDAYIRKEFSVSNSLLDALEQSSLLRKERNASGQLLYEISHDTLVEPIQEFAQARLSEKEMEKQRLLEKQIEDERQRVIKLTRLSRIAWTVSVFAILIASMAGYFWVKSDKETKKSTALFWASESDKLSPAQGLRLLDSALSLTVNSQVLAFINEQIEKIFNDSNNHQFQEKTQFSNIIKATFSPNSKYILTLSRDSSIKVWEIATGKTLNLLNDKEKIGDISFSDDSKWLVTRDDNDDYKIWEVGSGKKPNFLKNEKSIRYAKFSADGKWLTIENINREYKVWGVRSGKNANFLKNEKSIRSATFSDNSKWLVTTNSNNKYKIWEVASGKNPNFLKNEISIRYATFSADSKWLVTTNNSDEYKLWEVGSGKNPIFLKNETSTYFAPFSADGKWLISGSFELGYKVWEIPTGKTLNFLKDEERISNLTFSSDSKWLVTENINKECKVWEVKTGKKPNFLKDAKGIKYANFSTDSKWLVTINTNNEAKLWNVRNDKNYIILMDEKRINYTSFSADSKWLVTKISTTQSEEVSKVWEAGNGRSLDFLKSEKSISDIRFSANSKWLMTIDKYYSSKLWEPNRGEKPDFLKSEKGISSFGFSADGKWLMTRNFNLQRKLWEIGSGKNYNFIKGEIGIIGFIVSSDSKWVLTTSRDSERKLWKMGSWKNLNFLKEEKRIINAFFSADSKWFVMTTDNFEYEVYKVDNWEKPNFLKSEKSIRYVHFSANSKWLVTTNSDHESKLWEVGSGKIHNFLKSEKDICEASFSSNSKLLITKDSDDVYKVWDVVNEKIPDFLKHENNINMYSFSPDSKFLFTINNNNKSNFWDLVNGKALNFLKNEKNIFNASFSLNSKLLTTTSNHKITTWELATGKPIQTLWVNKKPTQTNIIDNRYLYVTIGKAIIKMDLETQRGNFFSYGDGEPLDYTYEEIQEWIKVFGDQYLLPLDDEIKKKYGIED